MTLKKRVLSEARGLVHLGVEGVRIVQPDAERARRLGPAQVVAERVLQRSAERALQRGARAQPPGLESCKVCLETRPLRKRARARDDLWLLHMNAEL